MVICDHQQRPNRARKLLLLLLLVGMFHRGNIQLSCKISFAYYISVNCPIGLRFCSKHDGTISVLWTRSLLWRHNGLDDVSNHRRIYCLLNRLFRRRSKRTPKLPAQRASNAENVTIWWRLHGISQGQMSYSRVGRIVTDHRFTEAPTNLRQRWLRANNTEIPIKLESHCTALIAEFRVILV